LLRWGIPDFTLPEAVTRRPWETLQAAGVELRSGHEVAAADLDGLTSRFDAVVLAAGASTPLRLPVAGGDLDGVWDATHFLTEAHAALAAGTDLPALRPRRTTAEGQGDDRIATVLVLGAGNTAMDVARSARRLGARAVCVDWMAREFAPVRPDELDEAAAEGVEVRFSTTVEGLEGTDGHVVGAHLARTRQFRAQQRPEVLAGTTTTQPVDLVVMAMGYRIAPDLADAAEGTPIPKAVAGIPDRRWQASGILANPSPSFARHQPVGRLALGREHARATAGLARRERMWVAGDALVGPSTVVEAMAQGKRAAQAILDHQPRRPGRPLVSSARVLLATDATADTASAAKVLGEDLAGAGVEVWTLPLGQVGASQLSWADTMVVAVSARVGMLPRIRASRATRSWLAALPPLAAMPIGLLCTYAVSPGGTLAATRSEIERHGGRVVTAEAVSSWLAAPQREAVLRSIAQAVVT
ncbi:MAG: FAD-dependent oxidoreductase, partial [Acidimicrobiales bacterium]